MHFDLKSEQIKCHTPKTHTHIHTLLLKLEEDVYTTGGALRIDKQHDWHVSTDAALF